MKTFKEWVKLEEAPYSALKLVKRKAKSILPIKSPINNIRVQLLDKLVPPQDSSSDQ